MVPGGCVTQHSTRLPATVRRGGRRRVAGALVALAALIAFAAGCGNGGEPAYVVERPASLPAGAVAPVPAGPVVLKVTGRITRPNIGASLHLDLAALEQLRMVAYEADDPQAEGKVVRFQGVLLADVLALAGVGDYRELAMTALNDYDVVIPRTDVEQYAVMIATTVDGRRMPVDRFGPTRLVYPNLTSTLPRSTYDPRWIWQLDRIEVR